MARSLLVVFAFLRLLLRRGRSGMRGGWGRMGRRRGRSMRRFARSFVRRRLGSRRCSRLRRRSLLRRRTGLGHRTLLRRRRGVLLLRGWRRRASLRGTRHVHRLRRRSRLHLRSRTLLGHGPRLRAILLRSRTRGLRRLLRGWMHLLLRSGHRVLLHRGRLALGLLRRLRRTHFRPLAKPLFRRGGDDARLSARRRRRYRLHLSRFRNSGSRGLSLAWSRLRGWSRRPRSGPHRSRGRLRRRYFVIRRKRTRCRQRGRRMSSGRELRAVLRRFARVLRLHCHRGCTRIANHRAFLRGRLRGDSAMSAVKAGPTARVHRRGVIVRVVDVRRHIGHAAVVIEGSVIPVRAVVAAARISKTIVHSTVETDMRAPVAGMPAIVAVRKSPIGRRPECIYPWSKHPCTRHPVVAARIPGPVAGGPIITIARTRRLIVFRKRRRRVGGFNRFRIRCGVITGIRRIVLRVRRRRNSIIRPGRIIVIRIIVIRRIRLRRDWSRGGCCCRRGRSRTRGNRFGRREIAGGRVGIRRHSRSRCLNLLRVIRLVAGR